MNLYLFPTLADDTGGYNLAVKQSYTKFKPTDQDIVVWKSSKTPESKLCNEIFLKNDNFFAIKTLIKIIRGRFSIEVDVSELHGIKDRDFKFIYCDDVIFYRAIREIFPTKKITVRFHNCFSRILDRQRIIKVSSGWRFKGKMKILSRLEREIFNDNAVDKIFLSEEDATYYSLMTGKSDYSVLKYPIKYSNQNTKQKKISNRIVWWGGIESHKKSSVEWFCKDVWPQIIKKYPETEFHLFGYNTFFFDDKKQNIFGHGYFSGDGVPFEGHALFINPDLLGGGVKIKIATYLENGLTFISTPFGFEGYEKNIIDNKRCFVVEPDLWFVTINSIIESI